MNRDIKTKTMGRGNAGTAPLAAALLLVLAVLPARAVLAQDHHVVERGVLLERFHRALSDALDDASQAGHALEPESVRLSYPESSGWTGAAIAAIGAASIGGAVATYALLHGSAATVPAIVYAGASKKTAFDMAFVGIGILGTSSISLLGAGEVADPGAPSAERIDHPLRWNNSRLDFLQGSSDFFYNRLEVHYALRDPSGGTEEGSCLAFFALEEYLHGGRGLGYALDACSHDEAFPQTVPTWTGDVRIGHYVDAWDRLLGQDMVVAKGSIPIP